MFRFRSFQSRLVFFILGLVSLVLIIVFLTVDVTNTQHAREQITAALDNGAQLSPVDGDAYHAAG